MKTIGAIPGEFKDTSEMFVALGDEQRQRILLTFEPGERLNIEPDCFCFNLEPYRSFASSQGITAVRSNAKRENRQRGLFLDQQRCLSRNSATCS